MSNQEAFTVADTSGLISLLIDTDANHEKALVYVKVFIKHPGTVAVSSNVITELMNVLGKSKDTKKQSHLVSGY